MDRVTYTPPTSELPLVGPEEPADAVPDGHQRSPFVELDRQTWARLASEMAQPFDQADAASASICPCARLPRSTFRSRAC